MARIQHNQDSKKGLFSIFEGENRVGEMSYTWAGVDKFIIDHTEVYEGHEGKGYGKQLVTEAVNYARKNDIKILPLCPYAKRVFEKSNEFKDVLF